MRLGGNRKKIERNTSSGINNSNNNNKPDRRNLLKTHSAPNPSIIPPFNTRNNQHLQTTSINRRHCSQGPMETLVTLSGKEDQSHHLDDVSLSPAAAKIIPAIFRLVPLEDPSNPTQPVNRPAFTQAGGHQGTFRHDGHILEKQVSEQEMQFYEDAQKGKWPAHLIPAYYGRNENGNAIRIENLTHGFKRPCVMDLKMGQSTVTEDSAGLLKRLRMTALDRFTRSKSAGCRLEGLSMYRTLEKTKIKGSKVQSHSLSALVDVSLQDVLTFFLTDESGVRTDIAVRFQHALEDILEQFEKNHQYRFIGSSILLVYDNDNSEPHMHWSRALRKLHTIKEGLYLSEDQISGLTRRTKADVRMIDFAHTGPLPSGQTKDDGYIIGLNTIITALKAIRKYRTKPIFSIASAAVDLMEEHRANAKLGDDESAFTFDTVLSELTALSETSSVGETEESESNQQGSSSGQ